MADVVFALSIYRWWVGPLSLGEVNHIQFGNPCLSAIETSFLRQFLISELVVLPYPGFRAYIVMAKQ